MRAYSIANVLNARFHTLEFEGKWFDAVVARVGRFVDDIQMPKQQDNLCNAVGEISM